MAYNLYQFCDTISKWDLSQFDRFLRRIDPIISINFILN